MLPCCAVRQIAFLMTLKLSSQVENSNSRVRACANKFSYKNRIQYVVNVVGLVKIKGSENNNCKKIRPGALFLKLD